MAKITLAQLAHAYLPQPQGWQDYALKPLEHVWEDGGAYALLGPSGCGKTTLLKIISGLLMPSQGQIFFDDREVTHLPAEARNIAQVFQFPVIYDTMTVRENLAFPLLNRRVDRATVRQRVEQVAKTLDLTRLLERRARNLTADVQQKVSLGRGLVRADVNAILFDEPLTVIDPQAKFHLRMQLKRLHRESAFTMIYVTHDQTEALTFADKVVVMLEGAVLQVGSPEELHQRPAHTFVGHFIGSPGMNFFDARIENDRAWIAHHPLPLQRAYPRLDPAAHLQIGIRPEYLYLTQDPHGLPIQVHRVDDIGRVRILHARLADYPLCIVVEEGEALPAGPLRVHFDPAQTHVYANGHRQTGQSLHRSQG
jgi:glycerol transport system ATP-binding protein